MEKIHNLSNKNKRDIVILFVLMMLSFRVTTNVILPLLFSLFFWRFHPASILNRLGIQAFNFNLNYLVFMCLMTMVNSLVNENFVFNWIYLTFLILYYLLIIVAFREAWKNKVFEYPVVFKFFNNTKSGKIIEN